ncbi:DNA topoisomerase IV, alpha subunit [Agrocybe pediades]|nr:DNA topoisomerase IV, alpha subunit [Agrocybe pediades]
MILSFLTQLAFAHDENLKKVPEEEGDSDVETQAESSKKKKPKHRPKIEIHLADRSKPENEDGSLPTRRLLFPRRTKTGSARPFAQLFRVLDLAHEAALSEVPTTKRDIYYKDVTLFKSQKVVDTLVDDLAATFDVERSDLNIRSSSKGLICGSGLSITLRSGERIECNDSEGTLIPAGEDIETFGVDEDVAWVLIVEKEAVFQTLCKMRICRHDSFPGPGILITGKGYPDVATRHIVKSLADALPRRIPILCLVDGDPFGLDILSVYKYGSKKMRHENDRLAARRIKWLGIWASELESFNVNRECLLPITKHDERKAFAMLRQDQAGQRTVPKRWKKELQYMLHSRRKAEIEVLSKDQM